MHTRTIIAAWAASLALAITGTANADDIATAITGTDITDSTITTADIASNTVAGSDLTPGVRRALRPERIVFGTMRVTADEVTERVLRCPAGQVALNAGVTSHEDVSAITFDDHPTDDGGWLVSGTGADGLNGNGIAQTWVACG